MPLFGEDGSIRYYDISHMPSILDRLRERLRIAVICGGDGAVKGAVRFRSLNTRNWKSYAYVAEDIRQTLIGLGFRHVHIMPDDSTLLDNLVKNNIHFAWINSGGVQGYNPMSHAPAMLEMMGVPYIGHNPLNVSVLDNKDLFKQQLIALGFSTSPFFVWNKIKHGKTVYWLEELHDVFEEYKGPFIVKPVSGRASVNVFLAETMAEVPRLVDEIYNRTYHHVLIEKYLPGREYCVAIYGSVKFTKGKFAEFNHPFTFSEVERVLEKGEKIFTSMDQRKLTKARFHLLDDQNDGDVKKQLSNLARDVYTYFGINTLIRLDVREDENGNLHILEVNPKPDLKKPERDVTSIVSVGLAAQGMTYPDLILSILATRLHQLFEIQRGYIRHMIDMVNN